MIPHAPARQPLLSIIVPAYNVQHYIGQCLDSVLDQMGAGHELIVIDDGSSDATLARVRAQLAARPGVASQVLAQDNQGIAVARNNGLAAARGDYIVFVDSDDRLLAGSLAALEHAIAEHHPDVIACDFRVWFPDQEAKSNRVSMRYPPGLLRDQATILNTFFADRQMYVWANVFRRAIYQQLDTPVFPPGRVFEDMSTLPRLLSQCASLVYLPHAIIDYRQHAASITKLISEKWCMDLAAALSVAREHLDLRGVDESVKTHFDIAAAHLYIGVVKDSYELPRAVGRRVRARIKPIFVNSLYGHCASMLAAVQGAQTVSYDRTHDARTIRQVERALAGSLVFRVRQTASRKIKLWKRLRRHRKLLLGA
ncbi:glycosyltransferase family 2 protein [Massilia sp. P8910]|uniref:glycosyltransferase family 2 protein n=1 Tax=Massilia antarctica TaxID=2765360 RepID=UPI0006BB71B6|nr:MULTISPECIES: glycosyltransferase family A protein [Massilia]MCE3604033.1 glycosyltransferase family 2 protein [Massilia antarctica]MCY0911084.1 glycosyltransferase family A protein [Massilia sp. H27-R4]CUI05335.1 probable glycosyl transferase [Janthinobacterium sp. CG23_2]CUU29121.1 probable glycosyl transferase [Janthinobacterium sp. CG23_2]